MNSRIHVKVAAGCCALLAGTLLGPAAPTVAAATPTGDATAGSTYLMRASDLRGDYGSLQNSMTNDFGRGALPSACEPLTSGVRVMGRAAPRTLFSELEYPDRFMWQNTVFTYSSPSAASASFEQLRGRALARCHGEAFSPYGDDFANVPNVNAVAARRLPADGSWPRFVSARSHILLEPGQAPPGYTDDFGFAVFTLVGSAIVQVQVYSITPIPGSARADAVHVAEQVSARYASSER
jgi:hypothetical protein